MMRNDELWIGLPVITLVDGTRWAVLTITGYAMSRQYVLKIKRGWEERAIVVEWDEYNALLSPETNPQQRFDLEGAAPTEWGEPPEPEADVWTGEIQHSQLCVASGEPGCHHACPVLRWYGEQDPSTLEHSQECLESGEAECHSGCPVALWYVAHPEVSREGLESAEGDGDGGGV